ncbi:hypothetical protein FIC27_25070, partial [Escherichia coli]
RIGELERELEEIKRTASGNKMGDEKVNAVAAEQAPNDKKEMGLKAGFIYLPDCIPSWEVKLSACHLSCLCRSGCRSRLSCV